jgi:ankyrin repeat protein
LEALFLTDPAVDRDRLLDLKGERAADTCEWILTDQLYKAWFYSDSCLLWLSGGPGAGKTMLSIFLAGKLATRLPKNTILLQYFCKNEDDKRNTAVAILRGLIFQLLRYQPLLYGYILPTFALQKESLFADASFDSLWKIFETMTCDPILGTIYCVLDGLDECDKESLKVLLNRFRRHFSPTVDEAPTRQLNLVVTCRGYPEFIAESLSRFSRRCLDSQAKDEVNQDVNRFIEAKVGQLAAEKCYSENLRVHVVDVFKRRAEGTFLWIGIVAEELRRYNRIEVENALDLFPSGLETLYGRTLLQIEHKQRSIASKILRWIVLAIRPLTLSELGAILGVQPGKFSTKEEVVKHHVASCGLLLKIQHGDQVGLIHQSAKEYLLRKNKDAKPDLEFFRVKRGPGHLEIAMTCLDYLQNGALADGPMTDEDVDEGRDSPRIKHAPLLLYAALHWQEHAKLLSASEAIFDLSHPFYRRESRVRAAWLETYWRLTKRTPRHLERVATDPPTSAPNETLPPLLQPVFQNASRQKESKLQMAWMEFSGRWKKKTLRSAENDTPLPERHPPILHLASHFGIVPLASKILSTRTLGESGSNTIDFDERDGFGWTALYHAAYNGEEAMVKLLLDSGAKATAQNRNGATALYTAAAHGYQSIVQLLLDQGANVNAEDDNIVSSSDGRTALHENANIGRHAMVGLLLENGADTAAKDLHGLTALHLAAQEGHQEVLKKLLFYGADIEAKSNDGKTALHLATAKTQQATVKYLLEVGASILATDNQEWTALHHAAAYTFRGKKDDLVTVHPLRKLHLVKLLLEKGADTGALNKKGETALDLSIQAGDEWHHPSREILLPGPFSSPLHAVIIVFVFGLFLSSLSLFLFQPLYIFFVYITSMIGCIFDN